MDPVVDIAWLDRHRSECVLADVRWYPHGRSGRDAYASGHLPAAVFVDLERYLSGPEDPAQGRHPLPHPGTFAERMGELGIGDEDIVVAYDDAGGVIAARLVWMLRAIAHPAALLDGGLLAWPRELKREATTRPRTQFTPRPWPGDRLAGPDDVAERGAVVIDARQRERFRGEPDPLDPRAGHIPGALSLPCRENVDEAGRFLPVDELRRRLATAGVRRGESVISYCGSGVTACHNLIAIEHAGLGRGRLYPGSWSQWSRDPTREAAIGEAP
ncbi:MAG: sulfurtransferase [Actinomycetota bacterium]|nr:sulfurtransferase [Actinomycetota bacterium]